MRTLWLVAGLLVFSNQVAAAGNACPAVRPQVQVEKIRTEVEEFLDTTIAELASIAKRHDVPHRHPVLGVYISSIGLRVDFKEGKTDSNESDRCSTPEVIHVGLALIGRAVHLPRDFANNSCLLDLARGHQKKHAEADEALL